MSVIKKYWVFVFLFWITIPSFYFLLLPGFCEPHDLHHFADIYQMYRSLQSGQIPPRWGPDFLYGYGYPLFNFYYLLPFYLGALFFTIFRSLQFSFEIVFVASVIISVFGMYLFLREFFGKWASLVGSVLFLYTPYRAVQIYVRGAMGEALALSLLPFVLWKATRVVKNPRNRRLIAYSSLIGAIFILSHNYFWVLVVPWILLFLILITDKKKNLQVFSSLFLVGLLSLGLTAYWWIPALIEQSLISPTTPFPLKDHFPFIRQLIIPLWGYGSSVWGPNDGMSFQVGVVNWLIFVLLLLIVLFKKVPRKGNLNKIAKWTLIIFIVSLFFMNIRSYPLWKLLPFHDYIQFPWRLLTLTTFATSVMAAIVVEILKKYKKILGVAVILASLVFTLFYFRPSQIFYKSDDDYLSRFFAARTIEGEKKEVSKDYIEYSEDYLLLPYWVDERPKGLARQKIESQDVMVRNVVEVNPVRWRAEVNSKFGGKVSFYSIFFPGWFAKLDGNKADITSAKPNGQIEVTVPPGPHQLEFYWAETPLRKFADLLSVSSLIVVGFFLWHEKVKFKQKQVSR